MLVVQPIAGEAWTSVLGAEVLFAPIDRAAVLRAKRAARAVSSAAEESDLELSPLDVLEEMGDAVSRELILAGARDWRGAATPRLDAGGEPVLVDGEPAFDPLPFDRAALELALADPVTFEAFDAAYVQPYVTRERERAEPGNGSAASPSGIGEGATQASDTASSPVKRKRGGGATCARTSPRPRTSQRKRTSGAS